MLTQTFLEDLRLESTLFSYTEGSHVGLVSMHLGPNLSMCRLKM